MTQGLATDPVSRPVEPNACTWCGIGQRDHCQRWTKPAGWHKWTEPTDEQRKTRMLNRRAMRLALSTATGSSTVATAPAPACSSATPRSTTTPASPASRPARPSSASHDPSSPLAAQTVTMPTPEVAR